MSDIKLPAKDLYIGAVKIYNADGSVEIAAAVADGSVVVAKLANDAVETAKIKNVNVTAAKLATDAVETAKIKDVNVTLPKLAVTAKTQVFTYQIEDLGAGVDITARPILYVPTGLQYTIIESSFIPQGTGAGIDDSNNCLIGIANGTNAIATVSFDTAPGYPASGAVTSLGALDGTYKVLAAGEKLTVTVTNGATANPPAMLLQVTFTVADAA
jgi:hypothetical protein